MHRARQVASLKGRVSFFWRLSGHEEPPKDLVVPADSEPGELFSDYEAPFESLDEQTIPEARRSAAIEVTDCGLLAS